MILGIDEAGRGPVIGPLVLCGVWMRPSRRAQLKELGVQDSKAFGSTAIARLQRSELAEQIRELASRVTLLSIDALEVDRRVFKGELNVLEQELARVIIDTGPEARRIIADGRRLFGPLSDRYPQLEAIDRADASEPVVAAASIIAKVERDTQFQTIVEPYQQELGPIRGGGYANRGTETFLRAFAEQHGSLPREVRRSWSWSVLEELDIKLPDKQLSFDDQLPITEGEMEVKR